ncbi:MAG: glycosyltransferase family 2 protein [Candidatus Bipolaricaulaceae bacterium]
MIRKPKVSAIMPAYNTERYLAQAIESVLKQTYQNFELIIVDDGSTDNSIQIIKKYAKVDSRIRFYRHEKNLVVSAARNTALSLAEGEWIAIIDSDDVWHCERLEKIIGLINDEKNCFFSDDLLICFDRNGELLPWRRCLPSYFKFYQAQNNVLELTLYDYLKYGAPPLRIVFPIEAVRDHGLKFPNACQLDDDLEFYCHLFRIGLKLKILLEPLYFYRLTPGSLTARANILKNLEHSEAVFERLLSCTDFSPSEKSLLEKLRNKRIAEKHWISFVYNLKNKHVLAALEVAGRHPLVIVQNMLIRSPRIIRYALAKLQGANIKW